MGAQNVRELLAARWGVSFTTRTSFPNVGLLAARLVRQNPGRVALLIVNPSPTQLFVGPQSGRQEAGLPIRIDPAGGSLFVFWEEDGELVSEEWLASGGTGGQELVTYETIIESPGPGRSVVA
ncbi:MAG: hypothetical protein ACRDH5_04750 [bacterium]